MSIKALILDMDGVLWRAHEPIGNLQEIFEKIVEKQLAYCFATNNAGRTVEDYVEIISEFGIPVTANQIVSSATATANFLLKQHPEGGKVFVLGNPGLHETLKQAGFEYTEEDPLAVVVGIDLELTYKKLATAGLLVRRGVPFIGTNPDPSFPSPYGQLPGAGALQAAVQAASGVAPLIIGKPEAEMFNQAIERMNVNPSETLMVGDRLSTDILGAQNTGCQTALVLSGVTSIEEANAWKPQPDFIAADLAAVIEQL